MDIENILRERINKPQIKMAVEWALKDRAHRAQLWEWAHSEEKRLAVNALWVLSHLPASEKGWLQGLQGEMIDMLLTAEDVAKKRILLQLLREQTFAEEDFRADLLDFCFTKINSECEPYAVRCFSIYVAFKICQPYPELINELGGHLDMLEYQQMSPGLKSAQHQTRQRISRLIFSCPEKWNAQIIKKN